MKEKLQKIKEEAIRQIQEAADLSKLNDVRVAILGKKGELTAVLKGMKDVSPEERPLVGKTVRRAKTLSGYLKRQRQNWRRRSWTRDCAGR